MKLRRNRCPILIAAAVLAGWIAPVSAEESDWSFKVSAVSSRSTSDLASASDLGVGVGAEVRLSPHLGLGIAAFTNEFNDELEVDFFDFPIRLEQSFRMTPVLVELLWHLTPDSRADLYVGPVAGYIAMSDLTIRFGAPEIGIPEAPPISTVTLPIDSRWTWGATLGVNVPLGAGGSFLTLEATHLRTRLEIDFGGAELSERFDLEPLAVHLGYGLRF